MVQFISGIRGKSVSVTTKELIYNVASITASEELKIVADSIIETSMPETEDIDTAWSIGASLSIRSDGTSSWSVEGTYRDGDFYASAGYSPAILEAIHILKEFSHKVEHLFDDSKEWTLQRWKEEKTKLSHSEQERLDLLTPQEKEQYQQSRELDLQPQEALTLVEVVLEDLGQAVDIDLESLIRPKLELLDLPELTENNKVAEIANTAEEGIQEQIEETKKDILNQRKHLYWKRTAHFSERALYYADYLQEHYGTAYEIAIIAATGILSGPFKTTMMFGKAAGFDALFGEAIQKGKEEGIENLSAKINEWDPLLTNEEADNIAKVVVKGGAGALGLTPLKKPHLDHHKHKHEVQQEIHHKDTDAHENNINNKESSDDSVKEDLDSFDKKSHNQKKVTLNKQEESFSSPAASSGMPDPDDDNHGKRESKKQKNDYEIKDPEYLKKYEHFQKESGRYECERAESPIWKELENFKEGYKTNGLKGRAERFYRWDKLHSDIEVYNKNAEYLGSLDPVTKKMYRLGNKLVDKILEKLL